jgi:hypothetical protein
MKYIHPFSRRPAHKNAGFVLPYTLFICGIMLLISVSISTILTKQIYFSIIARESQLAYYAADNAIACAISIDQTYATSTEGFFPWDPSESNETDDQITIMTQALNEVNANRAGGSLPPLADAPTNIICAQSDIFSTDPLRSNFYVEPTNYIRQLSGGATEEGKTSSYSMRMDLGNNVYRCAKVTINKTPSFRQIIAQGYSRCDRPDGSIERAVINTQQ